MSQWLANLRGSVPCTLPQPGVSWQVGPLLQITITCHITVAADEAVLPLSDIVKLAAIKVALVVKQSYHFTTSMFMFDITCEICAQVFPAQIQNENQSKGKGEPCTWYPDQPCGPKAR